MSDINEKEKLARDFMYNKFIPALHNLVSISNPSEYKRWGGNTCRQTAVFGVYYLNKLLPNYEWTAWDGNFSDVIQGQRRTYNHAWIHGLDKENKRGLLVDLSRVDRERLFILVNENKHPKKHPEYKHMKLINKEKMDIEERMKEPEYYTFLEGEDFIKALKLDV